MALPVGDLNPVRRTPWLVWLLAVTNVAVFAWQWTLPVCEQAAFVLRHGVVPRELTTGSGLSADEVAAVLGDCAPAAQEPLIFASVFTAMFVHGSLGHLLGNLIYLLVFGNNVEDRLGHGRFVVFYLAGGVAATAAFTVLQPDSGVPLVGASGAIAAILGAYLICFPRARVLALVPFPLYLFAVLIPGIRLARWLLIAAILIVPAWLLLLGWFVLQAMATGQAPGDGVAYDAHVAGFVAGIVLVLLLDARRTRTGREPFHPPRRRPRGP